MKIARWQTRGGKHWVELFRNSDNSYSYTGNDCGGSLGVLKSESDAIQIMTNKLHYMVPDNAKIGMLRVS